MYYEVWNEPDWIIRSWTLSGDKNYYTLQYSQPGKQRKNVNPFMFAGLTQGLYKNWILGHRHRRTAGLFFMAPTSPLRNNSPQPNNHSSGLWPILHTTNRPLLPNSDLRRKKYGIRHFLWHSTYRGVLRELISGGPTYISFELVDGQIRKTEAWGLITHPTNEKNQLTIQCYALLIP
jgi:hypothetical protein